MPPSTRPPPPAGRAAGGRAARPPNLDKPDRAAPDERRSNFTSSSGRRAPASGAACGRSDSAGTPARARVTRDAGTPALAPPRPRDARRAGRGGRKAPPRLAHRLDAFGRRLPAVACWLMAEFSRVEASRKGCLRPGLPGGAMFSLPWRWFPPIGAPGGMARLLRVREAAGASYVPGGRESWRQPVGGSRNSNSGQLCSRTRQYGERLVQPRRSMTCLSELYFSASSIEAPRFSNAMAKRRWRAGPRGRTGSRRRPSAGRGPRTAGSARWPTPTAPPTSRDVAGPSRGLEARGKTDRFNSRPSATRA